MKKIFVAITSVLLLTGCGINMQTYQIPDVTKAETITLSKNNGQRNIHGITIIAKGNIDGKATISLILNDGPYKTEKLSGNIDFKWGGDWYSDSIEIRYEPIFLISGSLKLKYRFEDI